MPDEAAVAEAPVVEDSPGTTQAPASPDSPTSAPEVPDGYVEEKRLKDTQAALTEKNELLADIEGRNGPERQAQALSEHARIELENEEAEAEPEEEEFGDFRDPIEEIDALKAERSEELQARENEEWDRKEEAWVDQTRSELETQESLKLTKAEKELVDNYAYGHRDPHSGEPDMQGGIAALKASWESQRQSYLESKNSFVVPTGTEGEPKVDLRDKEARQKLATEAFEAAERAKET